MKLRFFYYPKMAIWVPFRVEYSLGTRKFPAFSIWFRLGWKYFSPQIHSAAYVSTYQQAKGAA